MEERRTVRVYFFSWSTLGTIFLFAFALAYGLFESLKGFFPVIGMILIGIEAIYAAYHLYQKVKYGYSGGDKFVTLALTIFCMIVTYMIFILGGVEDTEGIMDFILVILGMVVLAAPFCYMIGYWMQSISISSGGVRFWPVVKSLFSGGIIMYLFFTS